MFVDNRLNFKVFLYNETEALKGFRFVNLDGEYRLIMHTFYVGFYYFLSLMKIINELGYSTYAIERIERAVMKCGELFMKVDNYSVIMQHLRRSLETSWYVPSVQKIINVKDEILKEEIYNAKTTNEDYYTDDVI